MNKLLSTTFALSFLSLSYLAYADSTISIPVPANNVIAANSETQLALNALPNEVPYMITCEVDNASPASMDMSFSPRLAPNGGYGVAKINGKPVLQNTGTLQSGENTFSFMTSVSTSKAKNSFILIKNLDTRYASTIKSCQAKPVSNVANAANQTHGGYFYVTNHFPYFLDITVGNYYPTPYCIYPFTSQYVEVSTAYQNIDVLGTHT